MQLSIKQKAETPRAITAKTYLKPAMLTQSTAFSVDLDSLNVHLPLYIQHTARLS